MDVGRILGGRRRYSPRQAKHVRRGFWSKMGSVSAIPFAVELVAIYYAAFDRNAPLKVRATLLAALAYFLMPVDAIPDVFPIIGFTDDAAVVMAALKAVSGHVTEKHYSAARTALAGLRRGGLRRSRA